MALQADLQRKKDHFNVSEEPKKPLSEARKAHIAQLANARRGTKMAKYTVTEKTLEGRRRGGDTRRGKKMPHYTVSEKKLEHLAQLHESMRGREQTEEHKRKNSEGLRKKYAEDTEWSERQRANARRIVQDPEVRKKNSESQQRLWENPEHVQKHLEAMACPEVREQIRQAQLGRVHTEERNRKIAEATSKSQLARWAAIPLEERRRVTLAGRRASQLANASSLETQVAGLLDALGIEYTPQYQVGMTHVDFYVPSRNLLIEVNGCWWHGCEQCVENTAEAQEKRQQDRKRLYFLRSQGYTVYTIWEHDMKDAGSQGMIGLLSRLTG